MTITKEQKDYLSKYIKNLDKVLLSDDIEDLLLEIDNAIVDTFDANGNPNDVGIKLQNIYDDIYNNN